jgi:hypothetical protein
MTVDGLVQMGGRTTKDDARFIVTSTQPLRILACSAAAEDEDSGILSTGFPTSLEEFQTQLLAATSSIVDDKEKNKGSSREELADGPLCEFRRGFLDHLKPNSLARSVSGTFKKIVCAGRQSSFLFLICA